MLWLIDRLPEDAKMAMLAVLIAYGGASAGGCNPPIVCDPAPPPATSPTPTGLTTPIICDPPPPPPAATASPTRMTTPIICDPPPPPPRTSTPRPVGLTTPIICDPAPPPATTRVPQATATPFVQRQFRVQSLLVASDPQLRQAEIRGRIVDESGNPLRGVDVLARGRAVDVSTSSNADGSYRMRDVRPGDYQFLVGKDQSGAMPITLKEHDLATVEWVRLAQQSRAPLPLEEIRSVSIIWEGGLVFRPDSPWPDGRFRWLASGGSLVEQGDAVVWQPPAAPGVYLLQLAGDWGRRGLAVDAISLVVGEDGSVTFG